MHDVASDSIDALRHVLYIWRDLLQRDDVSADDDFFELGGHSLLAVRVLSRIHREFDVRIPVRTMFEQPTPSALAAAVTHRLQAAGEESLATSGVPGDPRAAPGATIALSFDQERLWLEDQLRPVGTYHVHGRRLVRGPLDVRLLSRCAVALRDRHPALRARFPGVKGKPVQVIDPPDPHWRISTVDLTNAGTNARERGLRHLDECAAARFDLATGDLFRVDLVRLSDDQHLLGITMHHIISDAWSVNILVNDLAALYLAGSDPAVLPPAAAPHDYGARQRHQLSEEALAADLDFWQHQLRGAPSTLALPTSTQRSADPSNRGGMVKVPVDPEVSEAVRALAGTHRVTPLMAYLGAYAEVLRRWTGQDDLVIGVQIAGRDDPATLDLIAFLVNVVPVRIDLHGQPSFDALLQRTRQVALDAIAHCRAPWDAVVRRLDLPRDPARTPVFQAVLNVTQLPELASVGDLTLEVLESPATPSKYDLALTVLTVGDSTTLEVTFDAERYDAPLMQVLAEQVVWLLRAACADLTVPIATLPVGPAHDPAAPSVAQAPLRADDTVAIRDEENVWSHAWLTSAATHIAATLPARDPGGGLDPVFVVHRPDPLFLAAVHACSLTGHPAVIVEPGSDAVILGLGQVIDVAADDLGHPNHDAHRGIGDMPASRPSIPTRTDPLALRPTDRIAVLPRTLGWHSLSTNLAASSGASVLLDLGAQDRPCDVAEALNRHTASVLIVSVPALLALASDVDARLDTLRLLLIENDGTLLSETIPHAWRLAPHAQVLSIQAPDSVGWPQLIYDTSTLPSSPNWPLRVPLGTLTSQVGLRPLDAQRSGAGVGEVAEVVHGDRRTGVLGRHEPGGLVACVGETGAGRADDRAETLAAILGNPGVRAVFIDDQSYGSVAYVAADSSLAADDLRQSLTGQLRPTLLPDHLDMVAHLPWDADRAIGPLPEPEVAAAAAPGGFVAPRTPMEDDLAAALAELLNVDAIGVHDIFFEIGGFSLLATQLISRVQDQYGVEVSLREVFTHPTVARLAELVLERQARSLDPEELSALLASVEESAER